MVVRKRREAGAGEATKRNKFSNQGASTPAIEDTVFSSTVREKEEAKRSSSFGLVEKLSCAIITTSFQLHKNSSLKETQFCKL
jgi:hypothetical protein